MKKSREVAKKMLNYRDLLAPSLKIHSEELQRKNIKLQGKL